MQVISYVLFATGVGGFFYTVWSFKELRWSGSIDTVSYTAYLAALILSMLCILASPFLFVRGRRRAAPTWAVVQRRDSRSPVVYLRSFPHDEVTAKLTGAPLGAYGAIGSAASMFLGATEEEQLAKVMNEIGPFVAVGRPGERLPQIGAARIYVSDEEWQEVVGDLVDRARLVVFRAGDTEGFWWEVDRCSRSVAPERLLFLLPLNSGKYQSFRQRIEQYLPTKLPNFAEPEKKIGTISAILFFGPDWSSHLAFPEQHYFSKYPGRGSPLMLLAPQLKVLFRPVFEQLHAPWNLPPINWPAIVLLIMVLIGYVTLLWIRYG